MVQPEPISRFKKQSNCRQVLPNGRGVAQASRVALSKSSAMTLSCPEDGSICTWLPMPPRRTYRVECLARVPHFATDFHDLAVLNADIRTEHVGGGCDGAVGKDRIN